MRKFILIASLLLVSATAQAGPSRGLIVASNEDSRSTVAEQLKVTRPTSVDVQKTEPKAEKSAVDKPIVKKRETDEAKARRIAARYGISW